mmetsp:Transcript_4254/g.11891  ORF Transcript_4254/g.11891 Transcript_4254/m.11891 type:complete len:230 (+) Transcript_4254:419-1108(+)
MRGWKNWSKHRGSMLSSSAEVGNWMSKLARMSGWMTPNVPTCVPFIVTSADRPGKKVGEEDSAQSYEPTLDTASDPAHGTPAISMMRLSKPWTTSKPLSLLHTTATNRRSLRAPVSVESSSRITSETSKSFTGSAASLFAPRVFSAAGRSELRHTWNSSVLGLPMETAVLPSSSRPTWSKISARLQSAQVSTSVKPAMAHSCRSSSASWLIGSSLPMVFALGMVRWMLL